MRYLSNVLIKPNGAYGAMNWYGYHNGILYLRDLQGRKFTYNVLMDILKPNVEEGKEVQKPTDAQDPKLVAVPTPKQESFEAKMRRMTMIKDEMNENHGVQFMREGSGVNDLSEMEIRVCKALASHQVRGDEILKGLRAYNCNVDVKIQENYLGGWIIQRDEVNLTIDEFLKMIVEASAE